MAIQYSIQKMVSDGTLSTIALGIQYLQRNDIYIRIAGEDTPQSGAPSGYTWSFLDNTTLKILPVVPNGVEVVVYRRTDVDAMYNIYSQNAQFDEATIDENNQQLLYIAQEYLEQGIPGAGVDIIEFIRDDGSFTYYRIKRTDGSYSEEFTVPSAGSATKILARESIRRSYAEAGYNLVEGSFEAGGVLVNANDVLLQERTGKAFSGPAGEVAAGTNPAGGGFADRSSALLRSQLSPENSSVLIAGQPASVLHKTYIITGRANIANPYWGAPTTDTMDPAAATANAVAIQKMLDSGARMCELDEKPRYIVNTLTMSTIGQTFCGQGKGVKGLDFRGGNVPVIARPNWSNINASGKSGMRVEHMLISDKSTGRTTAWSIDLTNGDSCGLEHVTLFGDDGTSLSNNYGVALGAAFGGSSPDGPAFVCHLRHSRLARAKAVINTSDSYVESNELWGNKRDFALQLGAGGTFVTNNQIVPGESYGIYLNNTSGHLYDILRIIGNYFDGSYNEIFTGTGIYQSAASSGLLNSVVADNSFWNLNSRGMRIENVQNSRIVNNAFVDCASSDVANTPDIYIGVMSGSKIDNTHSRSSIAPKTLAARVNLSPALQIGANPYAWAALSEVYQIIGTPSTYLESQLANHQKIIDMGRIINRGFDPEYAQGVIMMKLGVPYIGANGVWKPI